MKSERFIECLRADYARLREVVAGGDRSAPVPTCPGWSLDDLARHVAEVYLHKVECMRQGKHPDGWPPDNSGSETLALLDRSFAALTAEFDAREPADRAYTWYGPEQNVAFWIRRMAQETVIHRVDAELAAGVPLAAIPDDLAVDGIDELLLAFLAYGSATWPEDFAGILPAGDGHAVHVATVGGSWLITPKPSGVSIAPGEPAAAAARVTGEPADVLLWLWNRAGDDVVRIDGETAAVTLLRRCLDAATQ